MKQPKRKTKGRLKQKPDSDFLKSTFSEDLRQALHFSEFRIELPVIIPEQCGPVAKTVQDPVSPSSAQGSPEILPDRLVAEIGTCLWYLKTRFFKQKWDSDDTSDDDPRVRRALGRLMKGIDALRHGNVEIQDPTGKRYPQGGEHMMKPIQLQPTPGLTFERVSETVLPIIYRDNRLIQRGEVFVSTPEVLKTGTEESEEKKGNRESFKASGSRKSRASGNTGMGPEEGHDHETADLTGSAEEFSGGEEQ
ncbi:MAG: hypothetical protein R2940_15670 [Syntrophotaleaceae bacterium]